MLKAKVGEGKYEVVFDESTGKLEALRYGKEWRDCVGDGLILAMLHEIEDLKNQLNNQRKNADNATILFSKENAKLEKSLKFYANKENWYNPPADKQPDKRTQMRYTKSIEEMRKIAVDAVGENK